MSPPITLEARDRGAELGVPSRPLLVRVEGRQRAPSIPDAPPLGLPGYHEAIDRMFGGAGRGAAGFFDIPDGGEPYGAQFGYRGADPANDGFGGMGGASGMGFAEDTALMRAFLDAFGRTTPAGWNYGIPQFAGKGGKGPDGMGTDPRKSFPVSEDTTPRPGGSSSPAPSSQPTSPPAWWRNASPQQQRWLMKEMMKDLLRGGLDGSLARELLHDGGPTAKEALAPFTRNKKKKGPKTPEDLDRPGDAPPYGPSYTDQWEMAARDAWLALLYDRPSSPGGWVDPIDQRAMGRRRASVIGSGAAARTIHHARVGPFVLGPAKDVVDPSPEGARVKGGAVRYVRRIVLPDPID